MAVYPRNGPASRAVALDLVLRTFMNSADFQVSNPKIWENISKIVPGTTPQQVSTLSYLFQTFKKKKFFFKKKKLILVR